MSYINYASPSSCLGSIAEKTCPRPSIKRIVIGKTEFEVEIKFTSHVSNGSAILTHEPIISATAVETGNRIRSKLVLSWVCYKLGVHSIEIELPERVVELPVPSWVFDFGNSLGCGSELMLASEAEERVRVFMEQVDQVLLGDWGA